MGKGKTIGKLAAIGAAIAGVIFFWRKRQQSGDDYTGSTPTAVPDTDAP
jgi:hypothetical protein